ncbi:hypothetical protein FAVG1_13195 [Fusarium avenaceum]|nr:hypothetical protein FAVG1_13195 [Fusarium avenaceum]
MCKENTATNICQVPITQYITKQKSGLKPSVYFCPAIRGTILHHLTHSSLSATHLVTKPATFWPLVKKCNLNFSDKNRPFNNIVLRAFRDLVKYIERKYEAVGGGVRFRNEREAGRWLMGKIEQSRKKRTGDRVCKRMKREKNLVCSDEKLALALEKLQLDGGGI